jgi:hypothetical protein
MQNQQNSQARQNQQMRRASQKIQRSQKLNRQANKAVAKQYPVKETPFPVRMKGIPPGVLLGFNAKGTVDTPTQLRVVEAAFQNVHPSHVRSWTIRITGGTRSQTDFPATWSDAQIEAWITLQRKYGFSFVYVVNGNDTPESQANFIAKWIRLGAKFTFIEMMNEYYLQKFRTGDTSYEEVTRSVSPQQYVSEILPAYLPVLERLKLPFFVIMAPRRQVGGATNDLQVWNDTVARALSTTLAKWRLGVTVHLYQRNGQPFDYKQVGDLRMMLPKGTPIAVTEAGATGYETAEEAARATHDHLLAITHQLLPGDYLMEQILYKVNQDGFEGSLTPTGVSLKGKAVFELYTTPRLSGR